MAKGKKRTSSSHDRTESEADEAQQREASGGLSRITPAKTLKALLSSAIRTQEQVGELNGTHAKDVSEAVEKKYLHKGAFARLKKLWKMSPEKANEEIAHLKYYMDVSGLDDRLAKVSRLPMGDELGGEEGEEAKPAKKPRAKKGEKKDEPASNVVKSDFGRKLRAVGNPAATDETKVTEAAE